MAFRLGCSVPTYRSLEGARGPSAPIPDPKLSTLMLAVCFLGLDEHLIDALRAQPGTVGTHPARSPVHWVGDDIQTTEPVELAGAARSG